MCQFESDTIAIKGDRRLEVPNDQVRFEEAIRGHERHH
jgi:hypothetical protein